MWRGRCDVESVELIAIFRFEMSYSDCRFLFSIAYDAVKKYIDGSNRCMTVTEISELCDENTDDLFEEYYHLPINRGYNDYHRHTGFKSACNQFKQEMYRQMNEKNRKITREKEEKESNRKRKLDEDYKHAIIEIRDMLKNMKNNVEMQSRFIDLTI